MQFAGHTTQQELYGGQKMATTHNTNTQTLVQAWYRLTSRFFVQETGHTTRKGLIVPPNPIFSSTATNVLFTSDKNRGMTPLLICEREARIKTICWGGTVSKCHYRIQHLWLVWQFQTASACTYGSQGMCSEHGEPPIHVIQSSPEQ